MAGDVIVYVSPENGEIVHTGVVVDPSPTLIGVPRIWSKWGRGPEVLHSAQDCPYPYSRTSYYRIRS